METAAPDGPSAVLIAPVVAYRIEHREEDDKARIWWEFSEPARRAMQGSDYFAALNPSALLAFEGRYSVTFYERGCLLAGHQEPRWRGTVQELREVLGCPQLRWPFPLPRLAGVGDDASHAARAPASRAG